MTNKVNLILLILIFLTSCSEKTTELELVNKDKEVKSEKIATDLATEEVRPLTVINNNDVLKIWVRADGAPGMFVNENGKLEGFYVNLERRIMEEMDQSYEFVPYTDLGPLVQKIKSGEAHLAMATPDVPDYRTFLNMSNSFETLEFVTFIHSDSSLADTSSKESIIKSLFGKKVGVQTRGHIYQLLRKYKEIDIVEYPTTTSALKALNNKEVDAVPDVKRIGELYSKGNRWNITPVGEPLFTEKICTSFSQTLDTSIVDRYNKALSTIIDSGEFDEMYNSYYGVNN